MGNYTLPPIVTTASQDNGLQWLWTNQVDVQNGGTGGAYLVGDILTMVGGTFTSAATFLVTSVNGNKVGTIAIRTRGDYSVLPLTPAVTSGGSGSGCTLKLPFVDLTAMLTDLLNKAIPSYRRQWKDAQRQVISSAVENASNAQLNNVATDLGIVIP